MPRLARSSSGIAVRRAIGPSIPAPRTTSRSRWGWTLSSPTSSSRATACSSCGTRTRSVDDRCRHPARVRRPAHDEDRGRRRADRLVHRGLHVGRALDAALPRAAAQVATASATFDDQQRSSACATCSTSCGTPRSSRGARSASSSRSSTRPTSPGRGWDLAALIDGELHAQAGPRRAAAHHRVVRVDGARAAAGTRHPGHLHLSSRVGRASVRPAPRRARPR